MGARRLRSMHVALAGCLLALPLALGAVEAAQAQEPTEPPPATTAPPASSTAAPAAPPKSATAPGPSDPSHGDRMRDYHAALEQRRLGSQETLSLDDVRTRLAEGEERLRAGRTHDAIAGLTALVEHPRFAAFAEDEPGRAATYLLGDALATAGAYEPARAYLRRVLQAKNAWSGTGTYARRAVRRLVEIALENQRVDAGLEDVKDLVPPTAPEETQGEVAYLAGRAREGAGDPEGAIASYARVTQRSRFWAQATYLQALIHVERGRIREGENLFCKVADPGRQSKTTAILADERYFAVRDLARLALGRVAHEQGRFDDARYYYYLVPRDSARLAEALYESATSRYEKKDYTGARELLDELKALGVHHAYEDEAWILDAYVDLASCKFDPADKKLKTFLERYEPVRDATRRLMSDERGMRLVLAAAHGGSDAGSTEAGAGAVSPDVVRAVAALVRLDAAYAAIARRRTVLDHEASGLRLASLQLGDLQKSLATNGGVRAAVSDEEREVDKRARSQDEIDGVRRELDDLEAARAPAAQTAPLRAQLAALEARLSAAGATASLTAEGRTASKDLPDLLRADADHATALAPLVEQARGELARAEAALARDAMRRLDLRLSRLLRRARLGRIESVLGRKRALEVEIEAIRDGILPRGALDSLDAARYLKDNEEYWPFEGDDWPDEFVGAEGIK